MKNRNYIFQIHFKTSIHFLENFHPDINVSLSQTLNIHQHHAYIRSNRMADFILCRMMAVSCSAHLWSLSCRGRGKSGHCSPWCADPGLAWAGLSWTPQTGQEGGGSTLPRSHIISSHTPVQHRKLSNHENTRTEKWHRDKIRDLKWEEYLEESCLSPIGLIVSVWDVISAQY